MNKIETLSSYTGIQPQYIEQVDEVNYRVKTNVFDTEYRVCAIEEVRSEAKETFIECVMLEIIRDFEKSIKHPSKLTDRIIQRLKENAYSFF